MTRHRALPFVLLLLLCALPARPQDDAPPRLARTSCVACHVDPEYFEDGAAMAQAVAGDVHGAAGLSCHDCHGGDPDPALADDPDAAMDPGFAPRPFVGTPARVDIPDFCGACHSDPTFMRRFNPDLRVDQVQEYRTSHHGLALAAGDANVATCVECHGAHGVLGPGDPESPVYPTRVAETCSSCHGDAERMAGYTLADGRPLPTDQYATWHRSVHATALLEKGDLSAPTCNDCHGNHGATPPGVDSVAFVCGQCHGREAGLFRESAKQDGFQEHNDFLAEAGSCADCHGEDEPQAAVTRVGHFTECSTCHLNHAIVKPTLTMLGPLPETPCAFCHEPVGGVAPVPEPERVQRHFEEVKAELVGAARERGLEGEELFDELVEEARQLPFHTREGEEGLEPREEFSRLFEKFRLGETRFVVTDPATGEATQHPVTRCTDCHGGDEAGAEATAGYAASRDMLAAQWQLAALTARAERIVLGARRGGVETRGAQEAIGQAVDAQIELQVLVHGFSAEEGGAFLAKQAEGIAHAEEALALGRDALGELRFRRRGLGASLAFILLVLVALGMKIRQLTRDEREQAVGPRDAPRA